MLRAEPEYSSSLLAKGGNTTNSNIPAAAGWVVFFEICCLQEHIGNSGYVVPWGTTVFVVGKLEELGLQEKGEQV